MNKSMMRRTAESIRKGDVLRYHQGHFFQEESGHKLSQDPCGCVAGHAVVYADGLEEVRRATGYGRYTGHVRIKGRELLDLSQEQAAELFSPRPSLKAIEHVFNLPHGHLQRAVGSRDEVVTADWMAGVLEAIAAYGD